MGVKENIKRVEVEFMSGIVWKKQYAPREREIIKALKNKPKDLAKWKKLSLAKKIAVIDRLEMYGQFKRGL